MLSIVNGVVGPIEGIIHNIHDASIIYSTSIDKTVLFDQMQVDPLKRAFLDKVITGGYYSDQEVENILYGFLNSWGCRASVANCSQFAQVLRKYIPLLNAITGDIEFHHSGNEPLVKLLFDELTAVNRIKGTAASKTLSVLMPSKFVMWDEKIAGAYNLLADCKGYITFMSLMGNLARIIKAFWGNKQPSLESSLAGNQRIWQPTLAKLLDEWNWVRITRGVAYQGHTVCLPV